jgi:hypothetical protein
MDACALHCYASRKCLRSAHPYHLLQVLTDPGYLLPSSQLWGLAIGFLQLANPNTVHFTNSLALWLVGGEAQQLALTRQSAGHFSSWTAWQASPPGCQHAWPVQSQAALAEGGGHHVSVAPSSSMPHIGVEVPHACATANQAPVCVACSCWPQQMCAGWGLICSVGLKVRCICLFTAPSVGHQLLQCPALQRRLDTPCSPA